MRSVGLAIACAFALCACGGAGNSGSAGTSGGNSLALKAAFVAARCMRAHGVSGFPDPTLTPPSGANTMDEGGVFFVLSNGFAANAPAVHRAAHACGLGPP